MTGVQTCALPIYIERAAIGEGMRTLWDDGLAKVAAGLTSIEELARVSI